MTPILFKSFLAALTLASVGLPSAFAQTTERVSVDSAGVQGNDSSLWLPSISADGRYVAFGSYATNLVPGDTNGYQDVFVHDRQTGQTSRVGVDSAGVQGNSISFAPSISADGRYVAFYSEAGNLVTGDTNGIWDIFVHDRQTGRTTRVSVDSVGAQGDGNSYYPSISADGRYVAFMSIATNLVIGDTNGFWDIFVHDRLTGQTTRVSVDSSGVQGDGSSTNPSICADGHFVAFSTNATNLVIGDTNGVWDNVVHDLQTGQTSRVSVDSLGVQGDQESSICSISADGRYVTFDSSATNLVIGDTNNRYDVFVHDRQTGQTTRVSVDSAGVQGDLESVVGSISTDGHYVTFWSYASNLVTGDGNGDYDIFVHDRQTGQTSRVSVDSLGVQGNGSSTTPSISADGRYVAFSSSASNLVNDTNAAVDIFVRDRGLSTFNIVSAGACPGFMTLTINNATANSNVAAVYGQAGTFVKPTLPCQGLSLGISQPRLGAILAANAAGTVVINFSAPSGICGLSVQAVDITTCTTTNVIAL